MNTEYQMLKNDEKTVFRLRGLYAKYGYSQYKMSKFEEYDLYVRNKNFLISDNIITFTDTNGKLMALKPDVTLSIIKNSRDMGDNVEKVYYNENVYRVTKGSQYFKEIMQTGIECIGNIDDYCIYEVIMLASESLKSISDNYILDISHLGIVSEIISEMGADSEAEKELIKCIGEKNLHGIDSVCSEYGLDGTNLKNLVETYGKADDVIPKLKSICKGDSVEQLERILDVLAKNGYGDKIRIDFSVVNDMSYYNGFVFKGFVEGISAGVLSGGQYGNLMAKMGKKSKAIGFAVYIDMLERLEESQNQYDVDAVILYDDSADISALNDAVKLMTSSGKTVMAQKTVPDKIRYKQLLKLQERGVEIIENNA